MPYAELDGLSLYYERAGSGEPELLFVHGWCCDRTAFKPQFDHFARTARCHDPRPARLRSERLPGGGATRSPTSRTTSPGSVPRSASRSRSSSGTASAG